MSNIPHPCNHYEEDPCICDSQGEPKGQCMCGWGQEDHGTWKPIFKVGDHATPKKTIEFMDGTIHLQGNVYEVTEPTLAYFNVCQKDYELK